MAQRGCLAGRPRGRDTVEGRRHWDTCLPSLRRVEADRGPAVLTSAVTAVARVRSGELSPVDLVRDAISRIDALDAGLEAWVHVDREGAALESRIRYEGMKHGGVAGPLYGVPVGIKDIFDVAGMPTRAGAAEFARRLPQRDATVVARLRAAGAIVVGKTATTQFAYADPAPTRNPWHPQRTPGGSSSGSAAAVAAGMVPVAIGSQTVGSTLRPAAYCGVVGLKPTHGRVSAAGAVPLAWSLDHVGIFARSVADAALVLSAVAGHDPADPFSSDEPAAGFAPASMSQAPSLGVLRSFWDGRAGDQVKAHLDEVAARLRAAGARVEEVEIGFAPEDVLAVSNAILRAEAAAYHEQAFAAHAGDYGPAIRRLLEAGLKTAATEVARARLRRLEVRAALTSRLRGQNALLLPVAPTTAPLGLQSTGDPVFCAPASVTGLPAIALPSGLGEGGLPLALQLIGAPFAEQHLLSVAAWVEALLGFDATPDI